MFWAFFSDLVVTSFEGEGSVSEYTKFFLNAHYPDTLFARYLAL